MLKRLARLFTIKTRLEAYLVTYAIAVGAMERGQHYMETYPGTSGIILALACAGVPFIAGAKLLDSVRPAKVPAPALAGPSAPRPRRSLSRSRPRFRRTVAAARSAGSLRKD